MGFLIEAMSQRRVDQGDKSNELFALHIYKYVVKLVMSLVVDGECE